MSSNEWKEVNLGCLCDFNKASYSTNESWDYVNYLDTGNITENRIDSIQQIDLSKEKLPSRARRKVDKDDIVYSTVRPIQKHYGIIKNPLDNMLVSTGFSTITANKDIVSPQFVYYYLTQNQIIDELQAIAEQQVSTYPSIKASDIESLKIMLPSLSEQKTIADTLSCLDDMIELNNRTNQVLEEIAQAIFKRWFVDFEPFGGEMPRDWRETELGDVVELSAGGDKPAICSPIPTDECYIPIFSNGINNFGLYGYTDRPKVTEESVTVSARGTIGFVCHRQEPFVPIVRLITAIPKNSLITTKYLYLYLKSIHIGGAGTTQQQLTVPEFKKYGILVPSFEVVRDFTNTVEPMFDTIRQNRAESTRLEKIRDTLLPKLMSGEIRVPVEEVV